MFSIGRQYGAPSAPRNHSHWEVDSARLPPQRLLRMQPKLEGRDVSYSHSDTARATSTKPWREAESALPPALGRPGRILPSLAARQAWSTVPAAFLPRGKQEQRRIALSRRRPQGPWTARRGSPGLREGHSVRLPSQQGATPCQCPRAAGMGECRLDGMKQHTLLPALEDRHLKAQCRQAWFPLKDVGHTCSKPLCVPWLPAGRAPLWSRPLSSRGAPLAFVRKCPPAPGYCRTMAS